MKNYKYYTLINIMKNNKSYIRKKNLFLEK